MKSSNSHRNGGNPSFKQAAQGLWTAARNFIYSIPYMAAYNSTDPARTNLLGFWPRMSTATQALDWNLQRLIPQCRQLERNDGTARGATDGYVADIIGTGIDVEPDTGSDDLNKRIRDKWVTWVKNVTPTGQSLWEVQRICAREQFVAGGFLLRDWFDASRVDDGMLPFGFQMYEIEWLCMSPLKTIPATHNFTRGIEMDELGRPVSYHMMDYNLLNAAALGNSFGPGYIIPASEILHGYELRRPRQTHGEPGLAPGIEPAMQCKLMIDTELKSARATAAPAVAITSESGLGDEGQVDGQGVPVTNMEGGNVYRLLPGEEVTTVENKRPTVAMLDFFSGIRGILAAAWGTSLTWLDRDSGRANYSSSRVDEVISNRLRRPIQEVIADKVAGKVYERWLPWCLLSLNVAIPTNIDARNKLFRFKLLPDRPQYLDPKKDGEAAAFLIASGLSNLQEQCASTGRDWRKVQEQRVVEQRKADDAAIDRLIYIKSRLAAYPDLTLGDVSAMMNSDIAPGIATTAFASMSAPPPAEPKDPAKSKAKNAA